jgi:integrase
VRQKKSGQPVRFELTEQTRQAVDDYIKASGKKPGEFLFNGRGHKDHCMTTRQYARTKATLIYHRTGNLRAVQLLLGHRKIESTVKYLGVEVDDALALAEQIEV